ncbi:hypothetical protein cce_3048 [Crocosphaera subtropica ATCC 51142]|uniref:Uncharacterized protein n=1 Tax=Crocosphaera subtropica (strain ATCC 51142 / BH68) TaxID=43989 RepID=B1WWS7_CROS5|nr:hypothetical protein [Crocosphaera subtropica]ACB52396.1 hypothetical protein cce_3048 [Crocosphaera subtropica ATCC 51142]
MTQPYPNYLLELLVPWDLPIEQQLDEFDKEQLTKILDQFLQALEQPSPEKERIIIEQILVSLETIEVFPVEIPSTKSYLENWEVADYDKYFDVMRVQSAKPAFSLLKGVVIAYHAFLSLHYQNKQLNSTQIVLQKQGFISYACLLIRVCDLPL